MYWRRRALALTVLVLLLLLLIWLVAAVAGGEPGRPVVDQRAASTGLDKPVDDSSEITFSSRMEAPSNSETPSQTSASASPSSGPSAPPEPSPPGSAGSSAPSAPSVPPSGPSVAPGPSPVPPSPPGPPQPCPDQSIGLAAQSELPEYRVGAKPIFGLTVTNTGPVPCTRDLDAGLQELLVFAADGTTRLWSSNDCYPGDSVDVRTLAPGEPVAFTVTWAGRSSRPGCAGQRVTVPIGDYLVVAKLGPLTSPPAPFRLIR